MFRKDGISKNKRDELMEDIEMYLHPKDLEYLMTEDERAERRRWQKETERKIRDNERADRSEWEKETEIRIMDKVKREVKKEVKNEIKNEVKNEDKKDLIKALEENNLLDEKILNIINTTLIVK